MNTSNVGSNDDMKLSEMEFRQRLRQLPPSSKLIIKILECDGSQTFSELKESSLLPERTLESAIDKIKGSNLIYSEDISHEKHGQRYTLVTKE